MFVRECDDTLENINGHGNEVMPVHFVTVMYIEQVCERMKIRGIIP